MAKKCDGNEEVTVGIWLPDSTLRGLKAKAAAEGLPYQTLLSCLVHKYVSGEIRFTLS